MSTHIIDKLVGIKLPLSHAEGEQFYLIMHEGGDNNLIDSITNRRAREWYRSCWGREYEVLQKACEWARDCCGGCVRFSGERHTEPETFIRRYRNAMKFALDLQQARDAGISVRGICEIHTRGKEGQYRLDRAKQAGLTFTSTPDKDTPEIVHHVCDREFNLFDQNEFNTWFDACDGARVGDCIHAKCYGFNEWVLKRHKRDVEAGITPKSLKAALSGTP